MAEARSRSATAITTASTRPTRTERYLVLISDEIRLLSPLDRPLAPAEIGEKRVLRAGADLAGQQIVDLGKDGPRQDPPRRVLAEEVAEGRWCLSSASISATTAPVSATITGGVPSPSGALRIAR
jgi:hypothetical protein